MQHVSSGPGAHREGSATPQVCSRPMPTVPVKPQRLPSPLLAQHGPEGEGVGRFQNRWELPWGTAGLAFFAGATSSALDSEKDAVLLGAGVCGGQGERVRGSRWEKKSHWSLRYPKHQVVRTKHSTVLTGCFQKHYSNDPEIGISTVSMLQMRELRLCVGTITAKVLL